MEKQDLGGGPPAPLFPIVTNTAPPQPSGGMLFPSAASFSSFPSAAATPLSSSSPAGAPTLAIAPAFASFPAAALPAAAAPPANALPSFSSFPEELLPKAPAPAQDHDEAPSNAEESRSRQRRRKRSSSSSSSSSLSPDGRRRDRERKSRRKEKKKDKKRRHKEEKERDKRDKKSSSSRRDHRRRKEEEEENQRKRTKEEREKELMIERRLLKDDVRKPVTLWLTDDLENLPPERLYRLDITGDRNNLLYGYLYRGDIPRYSMKHYCLGLRPGERLTFTKSMGYAIGRNDDSTTSQVLRYTKPKNLPPAIPAWRRKRSRQQPEEGEDSGKDIFQRASQFVPVDVSSDSEAEDEAEEALEDYLMRRTKEFNQKLQQNPKDVQLWTEYIQFQDEYQPLSRRTTTPIVEKKLAIYKRAMDENPDSEELLLGYLNTSAQITEGDKMTYLWEDTIDAHPASVKLWDAYINYRQATFSKFTVSTMREVYTSAIQTLREQEEKLAKAKGDEHKREELRRAMVEYFVRSCTFEKQAGYVERAVALFQAILEFNFFCPPHLKDHNTKLKFLEAFWDSESPRLGEEGAAGWSRWLEDVMAEKPKLPRVKAEKEEAEEEEELNASLTGGGIEEGMRRLYWEFVRVEDQLDKRYWRPGKSTDKEEHDEPEQEEGKDSEEDPERVVLFDDLKYNIFEVSDTQLRLQLVFAFLKLLGADLEGIALRSDASSSSSTSTDASASLVAVSSNHISRKRDFLERDNLGDLFAALDALSVAQPRPMDVELDIKYGGPFTAEQPGVEISERMDTLFSPPRPAPSKASIWIKNVSLISDPTRLKFIRNVFQSMLKIFSGNTTLAAAYLRFESGQANLSEAREAAKTLLSANRTNLSLWNEYAQLEHKSGHLPEARKVYDTALTLQFGLPASDRADAPLLYRHYAEMEFYRPESSSSTARADVEVAKSLALYIATSAVEDSFTSPHPPAPRGSKRNKKSATSAPPQQEHPIAVAPVRVLKARNMFQKKLEEGRPSLHNGAPSVSLKNLTVCYALFQYITFGIDAACQVYEDAFSDFNVALALLSETSVQHESLLADVEELWESYIRLMYTHSEREPTPPGKLRSLLERALKLFPSHRLFLSLYIHWESRTRIENRLRRFFDTTLQRYNHPVLWLFAIRSEVMRLGTAHRIRSLFERALDKTSDATRCPLLWRYYLRFEVGQNDEAAAQRVYYRAINQIPYSKALWLDAFRLFHSTLQERDVSRLLDLMVEKEARLRNDVEEIQAAISDVLQRKEEKREKKEEAST